MKARFAGNKSFGVCIRLAAKTAETLAHSPAERDKLKKFLADNDMYIYTANAFVYGHFKGDAVKEQVYEPDWRTEERTQYTINVADILADVCPAGTAPSIQTSPLGFKARVTGPDVVASYTNNVLRVVAHLIALEAKTGRTVRLALEPEPFCFLETTDETIAYFSDHLYAGASVEKLAKLAHIPIAEANEALRRHLGIVYDICHQAVEYENISESLQKLVDAGVPIFKLQEAAALYVPEVTQGAVDTLKRYAKTIYLTQTLEKRNGKINRYLNVDDAIAAFEKDPGGRANGAPTFTSRCSSTTSASSAPRASPSRTRSSFTSRSRCRGIWKSRPTPGTCCRTASRPATSSTMSAGSSIGCAANWSDDSFPSPLVGQGREGGREVSLRAATSVRRLTTPTPNPSPQGGGGTVGRSVMKVGFIGLGRMGEVMVRRLLDAGHEVGVYNRTPTR